MSPYSPTCKFSESNLNGWKTLTLENDLLRVTILPEKGSDIIEFLYKPAGLDYLWKSPIGLIENPGPSPLPCHDFMDYYEGGWQEILPSGGPPNTYAGVDYGLHGELWSLPWSVRYDECQPTTEVSVVLNCKLTMLPLSVEKRFTLKLGEPILHIEETLTNDSDKTIDFMWGHHPTLGAPFLNGDCVLDVPATDCEAASVEGDPAARLERGTITNGPWSPERTAPGST
jgi:galactose mutarotase-like enzyme